VNIDEGFLVLQHETTRLAVDPRRGGAIRVQFAVGAA
jgi:hypothetical protein